MDRLTDEQFIEELEKRADAFFNECLKDELVKIKEKIDIECDSVDLALDVILDRIKELKGETK